MTELTPEQNAELTDLAQLQGYAEFNLTREIERVGKHAKREARALDDTEACVLEGYRLVESILMREHAHRVALFKARHGAALYDEHMCGVLDTKPPEPTTEARTDDRRTLLNASPDIDALMRTDLANVINRALQNSASPPKNRRH